MAWRRVHVSDGSPEHHVLTQSMKLLIKGREVQQLQENVLEAFPQMVLQTWSIRSVRVIGRPYSAPFGLI